MSTHPQKTVLIILDGFGLQREDRPGNAITKETAPHIFSYMQTYPSSALDTTGEAVGLFPKQKGNSEAGHLTIGSGRVVEQDLVHISHAIHDGTFYKNEAFKQALFHAEKYQTNIHILGLLTDGNSAHAHPEHLFAMIDFFRRSEVPTERVFIHLFTDGRDSSPHSAQGFLRALRAHMNGYGQIATIMGRFYAMDRNKVWSRTEAAYEALVLGQAVQTATSAEEAIEAGYNRKETDEYLSPTVIVDALGEPLVTVEDNDVLYFINARSDRARQLAKAFVQEDFQKKNPGAFRRQKVAKHIRFVAMTDFGPDLAGIFTAFPSPDVDMALAKAIGERYRQLFISETEKYAHVTYFINGGYAEPINGEDRELIRSAPIHSYADLPQMNAKEMADRIIDHLRQDRYDFVCVNFPNADMVGHTGDFMAAKKAVTLLDEQVERIVAVVRELHGQVLIVADHGNAEEMINVTTGEMVTEHTDNPVPCILVRDGANGKLRDGSLQDVAPTLLTLMGIPVPKEMTGRNLYTV